MVEAFPLYWPEGWKRTESFRRVNNGHFKMGFAQSRDSLLNEISRLGGRDVVLSTNIPLRQDGLPYASAKEPEDPGVAVYFNYKKRPMCFACDQYKLTRENIRAIALTIDALRGIERWGASDMMERAFKGFMAIEDKSAKPWRDVLGFAPGRSISKDELESRFKHLSKQMHPDAGGTPEEFHRLTVARDQARQELGFVA